MSYRIETIEIHQGAIDRSRADNERIHSDPCWENVESGMSLWANDTMLRFHRYAIEMLKLGESVGIDGPADHCLCLFDSDGKVVSNRIIHTQYGSSWLVGKSGRKRFGRGFVPTGKNSRIQKKLGLREDTMILPVRKYLKSHCSFVGGAVSFGSIPLKSIPAEGE